MSSGNIPLIGKTSFLKLVFAFHFPSPLYTTIGITTGISYFLFGSYILTFLFLHCQNKKSNKTKHYGNKKF